MKQRLLIVDGHNVIHAWDQLKELNNTKSTQHVARERLVREFLQYGTAFDSNVAVVFDGQGSKTELSELESFPGIQVFYSATNDTADSVIERFTRSYCHDYDITVVTADVGIIHTVGTVGVGSMTPDAIIKIIERL